MKSIAADLYAEGLRNGAGILDIGPFGSRLFHPDIIHELEKADGVLWEIKCERESL